MGWNALCKYACFSQHLGTNSMQISLTPNQLKVIIQISRALYHTPDHMTSDAIGWRKNYSKSLDVVFDLEDDAIIADSSPGMHLHSFTSTYHEIAGIALLNELSFQDDHLNNNESRTTDYE